MFIAVDALVKSPGFYLPAPLSGKELALIRWHIERQWLQVIEMHRDEFIWRAAAVGIERYHELTPELDHDNLWPKKARTLPKRAVAEILTMPFFDGLELADLEYNGYPEIYWRLVRPGHDVGPAHTDAWFHRVTNKIPAELSQQLLKVWVPIYVTPGSGLAVASDSHLKEWPYKTEHRDGREKPIGLLPESELGLEELNLPPGQPVMFSPALMHKGLSGGTHTRVSLEFEIKCLYLS